MALTQVTLSGTFKNPDGSAASGDVVFRLAAPILDGSGNVIVASSEERATLVAGALTVTLYATEGTGLLPTGNAYLVEELIEGAPRRTYEIAIPDDNLTPNLADFVPTTNRPVYEANGVTSIVAGTNITVDSTDPQNPIVSSTGGGAGTGTVDTVVAGSGISVDSTDPANPVVTAEVTQAELDAEGTTRAAADTALDGRLDTLEAISFATDAELAAHEADTTLVHGIADTSLLETTAGAQAKADAAESAAEATAAAALTAHEGAADPHPGYLTPAEGNAAYQPLDGDLTALAAAGNSAVLAATTASFLLADETKLDGIESGATADQTAAEILTAIKTVDGAASGLDADLLDGQEATAFATAGHNHDAAYEAAGAVATHSADTTSVHGIADTSLLETTSGATTKANAAQAAAEATAAAALTAHEGAADPHTGYLKEADAAGTYAPLAGASLTATGAIEADVQTVAVSGATETLDLSANNVFDITMDQNCTFTFSNPAPSGEATIFTLILRGAFTPTLPASIDWGDATAPTYTTPSQYVFTTVDGGTTYLGSQVAKALG